MYKVRENNTVKEYDSLIEAKLKAIQSYRKNNHLVEVLDGNGKIVFKKGSDLTEELEPVVIEQEEPTQEQVENAFDSVIRNELSKLFLTIDDYNSDIATLKAEEADEETINTLEQILDDLNVHVGLLQNCLDRK